MIDNIEYLNINSINALLKSLEEPPKNTFFILIHSGKKILATLKSRCLNFRIFLSNKESNEIIRKMLDLDINNFINRDLLNYYSTPGKILNLIKFAQDNKIDIIDISLKKFLILLINDPNYKNIKSIKLLIYEFIEIYLINRINPKNHDFVSNFLKKIES